MILLSHFVNLFASLINHNPSPQTHHFSKPIMSAYQRLYFALEYWVVVTFLQDGPRGLWRILFRLLILTYRLGLGVLVGPILILSIYSPGLLAFRPLPLIPSPFFVKKMGRGKLFFSPVFKVRGMGVTIYCSFQPSGE
jgi:hypothetical protein